MKSFIRKISKTVEQKNLNQNIIDKIDNMPLITENIPYEYKYDENEIKLVPSIDLCNDFVERYENFIQSNCNTILIADYDNTFTKRFNENEENLNSFTVIEQISKEFSEAQKKIYQKYHIYEHIMVEEEAREKLKEWYGKIFINFVETKIKKEDFKNLVKKAMIEKQKVWFRNGTMKLFDNLLEKKIPLILISCGIKDVLEEELKIFLGEEKYNKLINEKLLFIIGNEVLYDNEDGSSIGFKIPYIYTCNKADFVKKIFDKIRNGKKVRVLMFGDNYYDIDLIESIDDDIEQLLGVALDNKGKVNFIPKYQACILGDGDFRLLNFILSMLKN